MPARLVGVARIRGRLQTGRGHFAGTVEEFRSVTGTQTQAQQRVARLFLVEGNDPWCELRAIEAWQIHTAIMIGPRDPAKSAALRLRRLVRRGAAQHSQ